jgi:hypothetical protein
MSKHKLSKEALKATKFIVMPDATYTPEEFLEKFGDNEDSMGVEMAKDIIAARDE